MIIYQRTVLWTRRPEKFTFCDYESFEEFESHRWYPDRHNLILEDV